MLLINWSFKTISFDDS